MKPDILKLTAASVAGAAMLLSCSKPSGEVEINVASYNLRQMNHNDSVNGNGWGQRVSVIAQLIKFHEFDIFGTQEGFAPQLADLSTLLPGYSYTGVGREDGVDQGEHSAIFYNTAKFDLIDHGDFWLSETPDKPSVGWDAVLPRICSWGKFRDRESGREFMFFNLHMDHVGKQARIESAKLVKAKIAELSQGVPTFVTGDFNVDQTHTSYATMTSDGMLLDSYTMAAEPYALNGTFNSYSTTDYTESRIDHVFVTPDITVEKYGILTDTYRTLPPVDSLAKGNDAPDEIGFSKAEARTPSDHFPVKVKVKF